MADLSASFDPAAIATTSDAASDAASKALIAQSTGSDAASAASDAMSKVTVALSNASDALSATTAYLDQSVKQAAGPTFDHIHIGTQTLVNIASNINIGDGLPARTTGDYNYSIGVGAQHSLTEGIRNLAVGYQAQYALTTGDYNTAYGDQTQRLLTSGDYNNAIGFAAQYALTTGSYNIAIGGYAQYAIDEGLNNTALGYQAEYSLTDGSDNCAFGEEALKLLTTGNNNVAFGRLAGYSITTTNANVFLGYQSGYYETGASKLFIDNTTRASEADGRLKALIYGVFASATADQYLYLNADNIFTTGTIDVAGTYKVDGVQVVGNRVVDARCDDVCNSGDATTDGVIDALRDAMIAHGLIAAA